MAPRTLTSTGESVSVVLDMGEGVSVGADASGSSVEVAAAEEVPGVVGTLST